MQTLKEFKRNFFDVERRLTAIGTGSIGGKASGLVFINEILSEHIDASKFPHFEISVPSLTVIRTDVFDAFLERNNLRNLAVSDAPDDVIALAFQKAHLPAEILGDLLAIIEKVHTPLAVRSSSLLEDALYQPFAGVYTTKMIPNNQLNPDARFHKLMEAIKLVYASTFSRSAKDYLKIIGRSFSEEKMAVIIQEIVGKRHGDRFYPEISGVARSYNFYSMGRANPEDGVVDLALGLGKTIVDGGKCWTYSPAYPNISPPYASARMMMDQTQTEFWCVNMGKPPDYDPIKETEYLLHSTLRDAEEDGTLQHIASVYDPQSDRVSMSLHIAGPRVINFPGVLVLKEVPLNDVLKSLLGISEKAMESPVEIEFAVSFDPYRVGFLQVRPMVVSHEKVEITESELEDKHTLIASKKVLGNGIINTIKDIVFVKPQRFEALHTPRIALDLERINRKLVEVGRQYLLIGFGRWGSSDSWLGIPVNWGQVCGAKIIVEATRPNMDVELSQGSHFFHNLTSFEVSYFSVPHSGKYLIDWDWLELQQCEEETEFVCHVNLQKPLMIKVDGRNSRGIISAQ
jgi:hypothetical protein